jgi:hypothetical protein
MEKRLKRQMVIIILAIILFTGVEFPSDLMLVITIIAVWELMNRLDKQVTKLIEDRERNGKAV